MVHQALAGHRFISYINARLSYGLYILPYLQKKANNSNIDVIFLTSYYQICNSIHDYSEYFMFNIEKRKILLKKGCDSNSLESRFYGYLSLEILKFMTLETKKFLDNKVLVN